MVNVVLTIPEHVKNEIDHFPWVNGSEVAREEVLKKEIFEKYLKTGRLTDEDWELCEKIDWHPVDELPLKDEFIERLKSAEKGRFIKLNSIEELFDD
ncbi:MAG: hypothetical protein K8R25_11295 [Methanosarcinales archaeon]|nr:hypothetical protein [Methanosarcinales archaeon]